MNKENQEKIFKAYPELYKERHLPMTETCMCWGLAVGDGWFNLIEDLSANIKNSLENFIRARIYEYKLSKELDWDYELNTTEKHNLGLFSMEIFATQVKEKYGGLRFYWDAVGLTPEERAEITGLVKMVESMSYHICEECGNAGDVSKKGWFKTLCKEHHVLSKTGGN